MIIYLKSFFIWLFIFALIFIVFIGVLPATAASVLYVSPGGNDGYNCLSPTTACATVPGALGKALSGDTIKVATGTYTNTATEVILISKNITLSGGWDSSFISRNGFSIVDGQNARRGIRINDGINTIIEYFTIENGSSDGGSGINNEGTLTLNNSIVRNNHGDSYCIGVGISNFGTMTIQSSTISNNTCSYLGYGGGIYNGQYGGPLIIENSTINGNRAATGGGIYTRGQNFSLNNSTISGNTSTFGASNSGGGGIYFTGASGSTYLINNSTITNNEGADFGGGIYFFNAYGGRVVLQNTILAGNTANNDPECSGPIGSSGYNIIGDTTGCTFSSTTGDKLNVVFMLGTLQDNGGPTFTHWLYAGSPAIDGGNPLGCTDHLGNPLITDQRGFTRPMDGDSDGNNVCDIGAYEADPNNLPPPRPESRWYVTPTGNDANDCHTPTAACQTINGAIGKAQTADTVYVSIGVYTTTTGSELVLIDKNINLLGGWNAEFTTQTSLSTLDGQHYQRGITVNEQLIASIENFNIQNGLSPYSDILWYGGGGIYIGYRSKVTLSGSIIQANAAGTYDASDPFGPNGGGISMNNFGSLTLNDSAVLGNTAYGSGGGIYSGGSVLILNDTIIGYNTAREGGGISGGSAPGARIELNYSIVFNNTSTSQFDGGGGGINSIDNTLILNHSSVTGNSAAAGGGGLSGHAIIITNSEINSNEAKFGGGIHALSDIEIRNSAILYNSATYGSGGGIYSGGDLVIVNSTIAYNEAQDPSVSEASGGGIFRAGGFIQASNATIVGNMAEGFGGGISNQSAPVTLRNTILAENYAHLGPDCTGTIITAGNNLIGDLSGCSFTPTASDLTNSDPRIVRIYGWPGTLVLWGDSPAIDGGNPGVCADHQGTPITIDQIGTARPLDGNGDNESICDIGAYEYDPSNPPLWILLPLIIR